MNKILFYAEFSLTHWHTLTAVNCHPLNGAVVYLLDNKCSTPVWKSSDIFQVLTFKHLKFILAPCGQNQIAV